MINKYDGPYRVAKLLGHDRYLITAVKGVRGYKAFKAAVAVDSLRRYCSTTHGDCKNDENYTDSDGEWVLDEVLAAVKKGYIITKIFEIWKYDVQRFNSATGEEGLFTAMMNKFIKIKQEASGWPKTCETEEEKNQYINEFFEREDVKLKYAKILDNPGLRSLAKLILNSFWGKFGQRENQPKTKIVNDPAELFAMFTNPFVVMEFFLSTKKQ